MKSNKKVTTAPIPKGKNVVGQFNEGFQAGQIYANLTGLKEKAGLLPEGKSKTTFMTHISQAYHALEVWTRELSGLVGQGAEA